MTPDGNWNNELNMPQCVVDSMTPDEAFRTKQLRSLVKAGYATPDQVTEYTRIMMSYDW